MRIRFALSLLFIITVSDARSSSKTLCQLIDNNSKLLVEFRKDGCEFPEDNIVDCIYVKEIYMTNNKKGNYIHSNVIFRENADFNTFCLSSRVIKKGNTTLRDISPNKASNIAVYLKCPSSKSKASLLILTKNKKQEKICNISL